MDTIRHLIEVVRDLDEKGAHFQSPTEGIDTTTGQGRLTFHQMGALAEFERSLIVERTQAGLKAGFEPFYLGWPVAKVRGNGCPRHEGRAVQADVWLARAVHHKMRPPFAPMPPDQSTKWAGKSENCTGPSQNHMMHLFC